MSKKFTNAKTPAVPAPAKRLTDKQYVASGGSVCPECCAVNQLTAEGHEADGKEVVFDVNCAKCGFSFKDIYQLVGYREAT